MKNSKLLSCQFIHGYSEQASNLSKISVPLLQTCFGMENTWALNFVQTYCVKGSIQYLPSEKDFRII